MTRLRLLWASLALAGMAACDDPPDPIVVPPPAEPTVLEIVSALPATGTVGDQLSIVLRARTPSNKPVGGKAVTLRVEAGGGSVTPATATTDSLGRATVTWTLGQAPGTNSLMATADTASQRITITTLPAAPSRITLVSGNNQSAEVAQQLANAITVRVTDRFNNPTAGAAVTFSTPDGGSVTPSSATTNAQGQASATWTLGTTVGTQRAIARVDTATVTVTATATGGLAVAGEIVAPSAPVTAGDSILLVFRGRDRFGNVSTSRPATYTISDPNIATITSTGALRALTAGTVTITAVADQASAALALTILPFRWTRVDAGNAHTCAIAQADSRLYCWGEGAQGATGTGVAQDALIPTAVAGGRTYSRVAAGLQFTCAVASDRKTYCWGNNGTGQAGTGIGGTLLSPTQITSAEDYTQVSTGVLGACALSTAGRPICWGGNQLPSDFSNGVVFTQISGAPGGGHACGINTEGFVLCWGRNNYGQLGNNSTTDSATPVQTFGGDRFTAIAVGEDHTCGISPATGVMCWGRASGGQLGNSLATPPTPYDVCSGNICRRTPYAIAAGADIVTIDAFAHSTCGLSNEGNPICWGQDIGNLGNLSTSTDCINCDPLPTRMGSPLRFASMSVGGTHSCGITLTGDLYCWGANDFGQFGRNTRSTTGVIEVTPQPVFAPRR